MKRFIWLMSIVLFTSQSFGQVNMTLQVPPTGVVQKSQLWNIVLVNSATSATSVQVNLTLLSKADNRAVLTAATKVFTLASGARQLKQEDINPIVYKYLSPIFNVDLSPNGFLPVGNYMACYTITSLGKSTVLVEDCVPVEVTPLSPPELTSPADRDTVKSSYPIFTWLPPAPMTLFNRLTYDFVLVKLLSGQSALQAVKQNIPIYSTSNLREPFLSYPASAAKLDTATTYAWGIVAKNNGQFAAASDAWTFRLPSTIQLDRLMNAGTYVELKREEGAEIIAVGHSLKLSYNNTAADDNVSYTITDIADKVNKRIVDRTIPVSAGRNFIELGKSELGSIKKDKIYLLTVLNSRKEKWFVKFLYTGSSNQL